MIGVYDQESHLVAVAVSALEGPLVRVGEVEPIGRARSEVRTEICGLASRQGVTVEANWSGDPKITAWGVSMDAEPEWGRLPEGCAGQKDTVVASAADRQVLGRSAAKRPGRARAPLRRARSQPRRPAGEEAYEASRSCTW
ncbi:hypothetical protein [Streptomyces laurentii]|uniref:hypothetical protein n=1 Tax=Streptomyces laurentii TaxID=39478 RepID=UPI0036C3D987